MLSVCEKCWKTHKSEWEREIENIQPHCTLLYTNYTRINTFNDITISLCTRASLPLNSLTHTFTCIKMDRRMINYGYLLLCLLGAIATGTFGAGGCVFITLEKFCFWVCLSLCVCVCNVQAQSGCYAPEQKRIRYKPLLF